MVTTELHLCSTARNVTNTYWIIIIIIIGNRKAFLLRLFNDAAIYQDYIVWVMNRWILNELFDMYVSNE